MYVSKTLAALEEATIPTRTAADAFRSAAEGTRKSPGKKSSVYVDKSGKYSYGIGSQSTGGKAAPRGARRVGEILTSKGSGEVEIKRGEKPTRVEAQLKRLERSTQLSRDEKARYRAAILAKKGQEALPGGALGAMRSGAYGVDPRRKIPADELKAQKDRIAARKQQTKTPSSIIDTAVEKVRGITRGVKGMAGRLFGRRRKDQVA